MSYQEKEDNCQYKYWRFGFGGLYFYTLVNISRGYQKRFETLGQHYLNIHRHRRCCIHYHPNRFSYFALYPCGQKTMEDEDVAIRKLKGPLELKSLKMRWTS